MRTTQFGHVLAFPNASTYFWQNLASSTEQPFLRGTVLDVTVVMVIVAVVVEIEEVVKPVIVDEAELKVDDVVDVDGTVVGELELEVIVALAVDVVIDTLELALETGETVLLVVVL